MKKWIISALMFLFTTLFMAGCYDIRELNQTGFVTGMGIDLGQKEKYRVSVQVVNPNISSGGNSSGGGGGLSTVTYAAEGNNIFYASRKISKMISRQLHYGHAVLLAIHEDLAREEGITHILDGIERDSEFRSSSSIVLTKGITAERFLNTGAILDRVSAIKVKRLLNNTERLLGENSDGRLYQVIRTLASSGREAWINGFEVIATQEGPLSLANGIGILREGKLVHWLDARSSRGVMWVLNNVKSTLVSIDANGEKGNLGIEPYRSRASIKALNVGGKPVMDIKLQVQANIGEVETNIDLMDPNVILKLEKLTQEEIKKEIEDSIKTLQGLKTDIIGFGNIVHQYQPELWKKVKNGWSERTFPTLECRISVNVHIQRLGLRINPLIRNIEHRE
ncbi:Ger(x)C family spore germination protein [Paenibacillus sp. 1001270B_150601_E10]|uniref:Ger(x)C family spore germination protein n=1 Tax=Paenibacillus sp. 1001270B_150601_E10 TaxID=2787079 RepID=UPI00189EA338|nr:Ger(x)C family spore germination protein [Paenibacillus sp. 1001270B_150601_E10]